MPRKSAEREWQGPCLIVGMTNNGKDEDNSWRELCRKVADEPDPERLSELVEELIKVLDARRLVHSEGKPSHAN
jgi:hypothetical protein